MANPDKRLHAYKPDLAEASLKGRVEAKAFTVGVTKQIRTAVASVRRQPSETSAQLTEALMGDVVQVFEEKDDWAWVKLKSDGYVGYVSSLALRGEVLEVTHEVAVPSTILYPKADLKTQPATMLPMMAAVTVIGQEKEYSLLASGGYVFSKHLRPFRTGMGDYVDVAERFLFAPYYWGGKTIRGLDCSGLVQVALHSVGWAAMRDSDMQEATLGEVVAPGSPLKRGDLVFWDGHVGIMADHENLLHANGFHMMVAVEPLKLAVARIAATGKNVTSVRRV